MTVRDEFESELSAWMRESGPHREPEAFADVIDARLRATRPLPGWIQPERWIPMQTTTRLLVVPRTALYLALVAALALMLALAAAILGQQRALPSPLGTALNGLIAFDSNGSIEVANGDGSGLRTLVAGTADYSPQWSHDGQRLAYWSVTTAPGEPKRYALNVTDANGGNGRTVASDIILEDQSQRAAWSPNDREIAYANGIFQSSAVWVLDLDTGQSRMVATGGDPQWSPDGLKLALFRGYGDPGVYVDDVATGSVRKVSSSVGSGYGFHQPQWSPDGSRMLFMSGADGAHDIRVAGADGSGDTQLVAAEDLYWPVWSPDGSQIAFAGSCNHCVMKVINADGSGLRTFAIDAMLPFPPTWSPDGTRVFGYALRPGGSATGEMGASAIAVIDVVGGSQPVVIPADNNAGNGSWQRLAP